MMQGYKVTVVLKPGQGKVLLTENEVSMIAIVTEALDSGSLDPSWRVNQPGSWASLLRNAHSGVEIVSPALLGKKYAL